MRRKNSRFVLSALGVLLLSHPNSALACAVCFGSSDSALAKGLHWGVLALLTVVLCVLGGIASFFIYLAKRAASMPDVGSTESVAVTKDIS